MGPYAPQMHIDMNYHQSMQPCNKGHRPLTMMPPDMYPPHQIYPSDMNQIPIGHPEQGMMEYPHSATPLIYQNALTQGNSGLDMLDTVPSSFNRHMTKDMMGEPMQHHIYKHYNKTTKQYFDANNMYSPNKRHPKPRLHNNKPQAYTQPRTQRMATPLLGKQNAHLGMQPQPVRIAKRGEPLNIVSTHPQNEIPDGNMMYAQEMGLLATTQTEYLPEK